MKLLRKALLPLAVLVLIFSMTGNSMAQTDEVICLDLGEEDCTLYTELQTQYQNPVSTAFNMNVAGNFDIPDQPFMFNVNLSGAYTTDVDAYNTAVDTFGALTLGEVSLNDVVTLLSGVVSSWDSELFIDVSDTPELAMFTDGETIDLYIVDGVAYADLTLISNLMGDPSMAGVFGIDTFEIIEFGLNSVTMADLAAMGDGMDSGDPMAFFDMMNGEDNPFTQGFQQGFAGAAMGEQLGEEELASFASFVRLADEDGLVVFETTVDVDAVFAVPAIRDIMLTSIEQQGQEIPEDVDLEALIDGIAAGVDGSTVVVTERYDLETGYLVGFDFVMDFTVDPAPIAEAIGEELGEDDQPISFDIAVTFERSDINAVDAIELPEGATIVPFMELMGGM